jgi:hypothetical protein
VRPSFPVVGSFPIIELCFSSFSSLLMEWWSLQVCQFVLNLQKMSKERVFISSSV